MKQYTVIVDTDGARFKKEVNDKLAEGWQVSGSVCITYMGEDSRGQSIVMFAQAIVRGD